MNKEEFEGRNFFVGKIEEIKIDVFETVTKINQYVKELERLAKIGKAFEDAKNKEFGIFEYTPYAGAKTKVYPITEYEYNKVIEWAERYNYLPNYFRVNSIGKIDMPDESEE